MASASGDAAAETTLEIFGEIGNWWGYDLHRLAYDLHGRSEKLRIKMDSVGGDLIQGVAIRNFLKGYVGEVTVEVIGLAASSATVICTGADRVEMHTGAFYMVHNPATIAGGDAKQLQHDAEVLKKMETEMAQLYADGIKRRDKANGATDAELLAKVKKWMDEETWLTAQEAVDYGFADTVLGSAAAQSDSAPAPDESGRIVAQYKNTPDAVRAKFTNSTMNLEEIKNAITSGIKAALTGAKAEAETEATETATAETAETTDTALTPEQMIEQLKAQGYEVNKVEAKADNTVTPEALQKMINEAVANAKSEITAAKAPVIPQAAGPGAQTGEKAVLAKHAAKFDAMARAMKG